MRQIDNMTPDQIEVLKLKGMLGTRKPAQPNAKLPDFAGEFAKALTKAGMIGYDNETLPDRL